MNEYTTAWWSIQLLEDWQVEENDECHTIYHSEGVGTLQISAYRKDNPISKQDIMDFVELDDDAKRNLKEHHFGTFKGFKLTSTDGTTHWNQCWIADDNLLLFTTYNCEVEDKETESESVETMLNSIKKK